MNTLTVFALFTIAITEAKIITNIFNTDDFPNYKLDVKTGPSDTDVTFSHTAESKITQTKTTSQQQDDDDGISTVVEGKYFFKTDEGILTVKYVADENGYRPKVYYYANNKAGLSDGNNVHVPPPARPITVGFSSPVGPGLPKQGSQDGIGSAVLATLCGKSTCNG